MESRMLAPSVKLVAMTTRQRRTSCSPEKTGWKNAHVHPKGQSVQAVSVRCGAIPKTIFRVRTGSTMNNTETELREVPRHHHHKDVAPFPSFEPGPARRGGRNVKIHHQDAEKNKIPKETVLRTANKGKPYSDNIACTTTSNRPKRNSWN